MNLWFLLLILGLGIASLFGPKEHDPYPKDFLNDAIEEYQKDENRRYVPNGSRFDLYIRHPSGMWYNTRTGKMRDRLPSNDEYEILLEDFKDWREYHEANTR